MSLMPALIANGCTVGSSRQLLVVEAEPLEHLERERALLLDREVAAMERRVVHAVGVLTDLPRSAARARA